MRDILWGAAVAVVVLLLLRGLRSPSGARQGGPYPDPPTDDWFQTSVVAPSRSMPIVVKFGAPWCGPCRAMDPQLDEFVKSQAGKAAVVRVDTGERPELADHFNVAGIPQSYLVADGKVVDDRTGYLSSAELAAWVRPWQR